MIIKKCKILYGYKFSRVKTASACMICVCNQNITNRFICKIMICHENKKLYDICVSTSQGIGLCSYDYVPIEYSKI